MTRLSFTLSLLLAASALPAYAADQPPLEQRVDRIEKQLKAVQRKVFPGGDAAFQAPEIAPPETHTTVGLPASTPLNDLTARVDALEKSVAQLTGQVEQDEHRLDILSQQAAQDRQEFATRLKTLETAAASAPAATAPALATPPAEEPAPVPLPKSSAPAKPKPSSTPTTAKPASGKPAAAKPASADEAADTGSAASGDPAEDAYMAGYKLWTQKKYPEAEAALAAVVKKYPHHRRASYAQNLLGRAYLDDGQPASAAEAFVKNYELNPHGERAPDSLYFAGQALMRLKRATEACRVYDEMTEAYGDKLDAALKAKVKTARAEAKCK
jgi:TolA-binding protein